MTVPILNNPQDPFHKSGPEQQKELFENFCKAANGRSTEVALGAAVNVIVNAIRQTCPTRALAEQRYDEIFGQNKSLLFQHYDSVTGRRRSIFPFTQVIEMPLHKEKDRKH